MYCTKCKKEKVIEEMKPKMHWCKECFRAYMRIWSKTPKGKEHKRRERSKPKARERFRKYYARWYAKNGRKRSENYIDVISKWAKNNREKVNVSQKLRYAVNKEKIIKPKVCDHCHEEKRIVGHHPDYTKPLEVLWLCYSCHKIEHSKVPS